MVRFAFAMLMVSPIYSVVPGTANLDSFLFFVCCLTGTSVDVLTTLLETQFPDYPAALLFVPAAVVALLFMLELCFLWKAMVSYATGRWVRPYPPITELLVLAAIQYLFAALLNSRFYRNAYSRRVLLEPPGQVLFALQIVLLAVQLCYMFLGVVFRSEWGRSAFRYVFLNHPLPRPPRPTTSMKSA